MNRDRKRAITLSSLATPLLEGWGQRSPARTWQRGKGPLWSDASLIDLIETVAAVSDGAPSVDEAMLGCIRSMCQWTGWPIAHVYAASTEGEDVLRPTELWHIADPVHYEPFREATMDTFMPRGIGLPGRVFASGRPAWIVDVQRDPNFPRRGASAQVGLRGALSFAVPVDGRCFAVIECFAVEPVQPDSKLLEVVGHIGAQLGRVIHGMQTELALRESDTRFRSVAESATDAIIAADRHGMIVSWNRGAALMFGYKENEVSGKPLSILMPERFRPMHDEGLKRVADHGAGAGRLLGQTVEVVGLRKDGREFPLELALATWEAPDGQYFSGIIRDITERKKAEDKIKALLEAAPDPIIEVDGDGRLVMANARTDQLFGYEREEILGRPVERLFAPRSRDMIAEQFSNALRDRVTGAGHKLTELWGQRKDGTEFPVEVALSTLGTEDGNVVTSIIRDVTERKRFETQLLHLADHDALTGLYNRRRFEAEVIEYRDHAVRYEEEGAVLLLDLDRFKYVNDTYGHTAGDEVIREVAHALQGEVRKTDVVARLGGDEFAVLLKKAGRAECERVASQLLRAVRERVMPIDGARVSMTTSVGIAPFGADETDLEALLVNADLAMYAAKEGGGNKLEFACEEGHLLAGMQARLSWVEQIRRGLEEDRFVLYCQPILDLKTNEVTQYELLIRLIGDDGEIVPPASFIDTAERFGLIQAIDRWVLKSAIGLLKQCHEAGNPIRLEVNASGKSLDDPELPLLVEQELKATGVDPASLIIEITETAAIANMEKAREFADRLTALGCSFALDDFGSGFSSFYYLKHLPLDYLKIDGDFIRSLTTSSTDQLVVQAMVDIARGMGMKTVAEFVENPETVTMLQEMGVDYSQGFLHGAPRPVAEVLGLTVPTDDRSSVETAS
jgi:diguanylate cyclase (GGDEF)-like protein/PAS domain S-box-containing protein